MLNLESVDKQTREMIESVIAIGVEFGVGIIGAIALLIIGTMIAGWVKRGTHHGLDRIPRIDKTLKPFLANMFSNAVLNLLSLCNFLYLIIIGK